MLSGVPWIRRPAFWCALVVLLAISGFIAVSVYLGQNHRLHVVNGLTRDLSIQIDDGSTVVIAGEGRAAIAIGEGRHQVKILAPIGQTVPDEFVVRTPFWTRLFYRPVLLLDPLRACVIYRETTKYSEVPSDEHESIDVRTGELFVQFPPTDYLFHEFPETLHIDSRQREVVKTRVGFARLAPESILNLPNLSPARQLELAAHIAKLNPANEEVLIGFYIVAKANEALPKFQSFLESQMKVRPVIVEAHRLFQEMAPSEGIPANELVAQYDRYLTDDPKNPDLIYLRSRLEFSAGEANKFNARALAIDSEHVHAQLAMAFSSLARGEYQSAKSRLQTLFGKDPANKAIKQLLAESLVATKEPLAALETVRGKWGELDAAASILESIKHIATVLELPVDQRKGLPDSFTPYDKAPSLDEDLAGTTRQFYLGYYRRDRARMQANAERLVKQFEQSAWYCFAAAIDAGDCEEAVKWAEEDPDALSASDVFLLAMALRSAGKSELAEHWFDEGLDRLRREGRAEEKMADYLEQGRTEAVDLEAVLDLRMEPQEKRVFLAAINEFGTQPNGQLEDLIRLFNFDVSFPYYFIRDRTTN